MLRPGDRVAVKPHASPMFHAIQYLLGRQTQDKLERFRAFGGAQAYPSRTKDTDGVDFSTGSVGLGVAMTLFASLTQDLLHERKLLPDGQRKGRMIAIVGDAELDEGNVFEALLEGWKHDVRNVWWVIDYNRQSLDRVVPERLFKKIEDFFSAVGWRVVTLKYGKLLQAAFARPGGDALRQWIDDCPNDLYSAITFKGGAAWRERLTPRPRPSRRASATLLAEHDDAALARLMTNLGGHDLDSVREAFHGVEDDRPHCFIAYTIKGFGLPFAGHKDNHAGPDDARADGGVQGRAPDRRRRGMGALCRPRRRAGGARGLSRRGAVRGAHRGAPQRAGAGAGEPADGPRRCAAPRPRRRSAGSWASSRAATSALAARIITTSPDVTVSTNLGAWVSRRSVFNRAEHADVFKAEQRRLGPALGREPAPASMSSWASPRTTCS